MSDVGTRAASWGRIGGLRAWALNDAETMLGGARRGFQARFERLVDPDGVLEPEERAKRVERLRRAHMLELAERSAAARAKKKADPEARSGPALEARRAAAGEPTAAA